MTVDVLPPTKGADSVPSRFDLGQLAENGLRRGYTTGSCATAAVKAAVLRLLCGENVDSVWVTLPEGDRYLVIPIDRGGLEADGTAFAEVIKDGGDDPDQTHRARIRARVRPNAERRVRFLRGKGVGLVTQPGLQIPVGEPAINPVPRRMMERAINEVLEEGDLSPDTGFDLEIGCENGEDIASRTFNPRLGIEGGISILGTTGIVEPKSMAAFQASIEIYVRVALGDFPVEMVLTPGNLGQRFAKASLGLPIKRVVQMSNFLGFGLECVERALADTGGRLGRLWVAGHPGKLAKVLADVWDTHSHRSVNAVGPVCDVAAECGVAPGLLERARASNTVEGVAEVLENDPNAALFWREVEARIARRVMARLTRVDSVAVKLFQMNGRALGETI